MSTATHLLLSAIMRNRKNLAKSCFVTEVNGLDRVYTWGGNL